MLSGFGNQSTKFKKGTSDVRSVETWLICKVDWELLLFVVQLLLLEACQGRIQDFFF